MIHYGGDALEERRRPYRRTDRGTSLPLFYLHICNGTGFTEDEEGTELAGLDEAKALALLCARDIMAADVKGGALDLSSFITVEDADHRPVHTLRFEEAVDLRQRYSARRG